MSALALPGATADAAKRPAKPTASQTTVSKKPTSPRAEPPRPEVTPADKAIERGERVEFDPRLIQGQTAKAGAVYLFERVSSNLRSMVRERRSFADKITRPIFPAKRGTP